MAIGEPFGPMLPFNCRSYLGFAGSIPHQWAGHLLNMCMAQLAEVIFPANICKIVI